MPRQAIDPLRVAARLVALLGDRALIIGGYAVAAWGFSRATEDVDLAVDLTAAEAERRLTTAGLEVRKTRGDVHEGDIAWVLSGQAEGVPFQVMPPPVVVDWSRAREIVIGGARLKVVDLQDLLRLKLKAGGPKDLMDVTELLASHPELTAETKKIAAAYGVGPDLDLWIARRRPRPGTRKARK